MNKKQWTIGELADAAEVTVRTIRYYVKEGLLPPPETQGRYALYDEAYFNRLELIRRWKESYLPLREIRARIQPLSDQEVAMLLQTAEELKDLSENPPLVMAAAEEMVSASMAAPVEQHTQKKSVPPDQQNKKQYGMISESAVDYVHQVREGKKPEEDSDAVDYIRKLRKQRPQPTPQPNPPQFSRPRVRQQSEEWRRIRVMPGFELHLSEGVYRQYEVEVQELLDWIHNKFGSLRHRI